MSATEAISVRKFCGACGRAVAAQAPTCAECGAALPAVEASRAGESRGPDDDRAGEFPVRGRLGLLAILGVFIAFLYAFYYIGKSHL